MTESLEPPATPLDPGRPAPPTPPRPTELDPGRPAPPTPPRPTELDPGRPPSGPSGPHDWTTLPRELAEHYELGERLSTHNSQSEVYLLLDLRDQRQYVMKLYLPDVHPQPGTVEAVRSAGHPHLVRIVASGVLRGRSYEIMEYAPHRGLDRLIGTGLSVPQLHQVVEQMAGALMALHERKILHRDIKPANMLVRARTSLDLALADFGISALDSPEFRSTRPGTLAYCSPEYLAANATSEKGDWWAFGITLVELASGRHPFNGIADPIMREHISTKEIDRSGVRDERLARLCAGLLIRDRADRWGTEQVRQWLDPDQSDPVVPEQRVGELAPAIRPFWFMTVGYTDPARLGYGLAQDWHRSARWLFRKHPHRYTELCDWVQQFDQDAEAAARRARRLSEIRDSDRTDPNIRLMWLIQVLAPQIGPIYLLPELPITVGTVPALATAALHNDDGPEQAVIADLWRYPLLLAQLERARGGDGLAALNQRWRALDRDYRAGFDQVLSSGRFLAEARSRLEGERPRAGLLMLAADRANMVVFLRSETRRIRQDLPAPVPWFDRLTGAGASALDLLAGWLLAEDAVQEADRLREETVVEAAERNARLRSDSIFEWYREQDRLLAMGWALVPVVLVMVVWFASIVGADLLPVASDGAVAVAWTTTVASVLVIAATEVWLAGAIGGPYHPMFSMLGTLVERGARVARRVRDNGYLGLGVALGAAAALVAMTVWLPPVLPVVTVVVEIAWALERWRNWERAYAARVEQLVADRRHRREEEGQLV